MYPEERQDGDAAPAGTGTAPVTEPEAGAGDGRYLLEPWAGRDETELVPEILEAGETIVAVGSGTVLRSGRLAQSGWLLVVTDRRLLCIKGKSDSKKVIRIPVHAIRGADTTGLFSKTLVLETTTGTLRVSSIKKVVAESLMMGLGSVMTSE